MPTRFEQAAASPRAYRGVEPRDRTNFDQTRPSATGRSRARHSRECRRDLERRPMPSRQISPVFFPRYPGRAELIAGIGSGLAVEHVETGAFSRAVGTDSARISTGVERKRHAAHGVERRHRDLLRPSTKQQCLTTLIRRSRFLTEQRGALRDAERRRCRDRFQASLD